MLYFGVNIKEGPHNKLSRENYAIIDKENTTMEPAYMQRRYSEEEILKFYEDTDCLLYNDEWCDKHQKDCLANFDLNMKYMESLDESEFTAALEELLKVRKGTVEIKNLNDCKGMSGIYIMVLDKYKQVYIGQSKDIKTRIMRHWSTTKPFDRLLFGRVETSVLSIDCYGALDTTRIFIFPTTSLEANESLFVRKMDKRFSTNRTAGGLLMENGNAVEIMANMNKRKL